MIHRQSTFTCTMYKSIVSIHGALFVSYLLLIHFAIETFRKDIISNFTCPLLLISFQTQWTPFVYCVLYLAFFIIIETSTERFNNITKFSFGTANFPASVFVHCVFCTCIEFVYIYLHVCQECNKK